MNEPRIAVIGKNDRLVHGEEGIKVVVGKPVRVFAGRLQGHQIDNIDHANLQIGKCWRKRSTAASVSSVECRQRTP